MKNKTVLVFGGTGFVGRAVVEKCLKNNWRVVLVTRINKQTEVENKLLLHGIDKSLLDTSKKSKMLLFALGIDLTDRKWSQHKTFENYLFEKLSISPLLIFKIINLVGGTSKSVNETLESNIDSLDGVLGLVRNIKTQNQNSIFINMGSAVEKKNGKNISPYEYSKKIARQKINKSGLCDFHFVTHYIKGRGEQKMKLIAPILWRKLRFSHKWLFGFKVGLVDVDDLAEYICNITEIIKRPYCNKPIEVNMISGEMVFGDVVRNLLPEDKRDVPELITPVWLERLFLRAYSFVLPVIRPNNQLVIRLGSFAKRGLEKTNQKNAQTYFVAVADVKRMSLDKDCYEILKTEPVFIVSSKQESVVYIVKEKSRDELEKVIQRALIT